MPFMVPVYDDCAFAVGTAAKTNDTLIVPLAHVDPFDFDEYTVVQGKWFARMSAPGYLDSTEWGGPFDTIEEARKYIKDTYDVDPYTGNELPA